MAGGIRVLYVDDEPGLLEIAQIFLEETGEFTVTTATSAREALASPALLSHDAILADYQMPGMDGIAFLKEVRQRSADLPFILFTGKGREEVVIDAINNGVDFYLQKGGDPGAQFAELAHKIKKAVERKSVKDALVNSEQRLNDIINFLPDATFAIDNHGKVIAWNRAIEEMTGVAAGDMLGRGSYEYALPFYGDRRHILIDLVSHPDAATEKRYSPLVKKEGDLLFAETIVAHPRNRDCYLSGIATPLRDKTGTIVGAIESIRDITGFQKVQEKLKQSEEQYRVLLGHSQDGAFLMQDGIVQFCNEAFARMIGSTPPELIGTPVPDLIAPEDRDLVVERQRDRLAGKILPESYEFRMFHKDATTRVPVMLSVGIGTYRNRPAVIGTVHDMTKEREREHALRENEEKYRSLVETSFDGILIHQDGSIVYANKTAVRLFGAGSADEIVGMPVLSFVPPDFRAVVHERMTSATGEIQPILHEKFLRTDGSTIDVDVVAIPFVWKDRPAVHVVFRDITESKTARERLQRSEERFRSLIQNSSDMIRILDRDGIISYSSPSTLRITGYNPGDLIGKNMLDYVHPLDREHVNHAFGEVCAGTNPDTPTEYRIRHTDGYYIDVEAIASNQLDIPAVEGIVTTTRPITERKRKEEEIAFMNAILSAQQETSLDGILIVDDDGKIINYNRKFPEIWGIPEALLVSKIDEPVLRHINEQLADPEAFLVRVRYLYDHREEKSFEELLLKDGRVLERFSAPVSGESGKYYGRIWYFRDITGKKRAELAVARSKTYLDQIFSSVKAGIVIMDAKTHEIVDINPAGAAMIGLPKDRIIGNTCHRFICPSETGRCPITDLSQDVDNAERTLITGDGRAVPIIKYVVRTNLDGRECLLETFIDNSERRKAEDAVRESEAKYRELADLLPQIVYELDVDLRVTYANQHALAVFGLTGKELTDGVTALSFIDPSQHGTIKDDMRKFLAGTPFEPREYTAIKKDGSTFSAIIYPGPVYRNKTLSGFRGVIVDISARKAMEGELRASEEKFRSIFENSPYPIAINSFPDNTFLEVNKAFLTVSGYTEPEIIGKDPAGIGLLPLPEVLRLISHRLLKGKIENVPLALTAKGGKRIHVLFSTMPITIGNRPALVTVTAEVTKLKRVEEELLRKNEDLNAAYEDLTTTHEEVRQNYEELARKEEVLRESEEKFRALVELSLDGILIADFSGTILFLNRAAARIIDVEDYGAAAGKRNVMEFVAPESQAAVLNDFANVARDNDTYIISYKLITETKREIWVESISRKIPFGNTTAALISLQDITGRKLAEVAVRESEKKFATVFRSSPVALTLVSAADGKFVDVNDTFTGQTGYSHTEVIGRTSEELGLFADRDEYERFLSTLQDKQAVDGMELTCRMKSTGIRTCLFSSRIIVMNGRPQILSSVQDVTERRRAEEALRQAGKKLNLLFGITRHDIKNQLLTLEGFVALLHKKIPDPSYNEYFSRITKVSSQIASLIQFTKEYEMIGVHAPAWLDIRTLVDDAGKNVAFGPVVLDNDLPAGVEIFADPLIAKVFFNLIDNALRHGGKITKIRFSLEERDGDRIIVCADDGGGVSADEKERIFDPGFGKNTGFGLSISREILDITGITITENGEPGKGARFEITVPGGHGGLPVKKGAGEITPLPHSPESR